MASLAGMAPQLARKRSIEVEQAPSRPFLPDSMLAALAGNDSSDVLPEHLALRRIKQASKPLQELNAGVYSTDMSSSLEPHAVAEAQRPSRVAQVLELQPPFNKIGRRGRDQQVLEAVLHESTVNLTLAEKRVAQMKAVRSTSIGKGLTADTDQQQGGSPGSEASPGDQGGIITISDLDSGLTAEASSLLRGNDFSLASVASVTLAVVERAREQDPVLFSQVSQSLASRIAMADLGSSSGVGKSIVDAVQSAAVRMIEAEKHIAQEARHGSRGIDVEAARTPPLTQSQVAALLLRLSSALASKDLQEVIASLQQLMYAPEPPQDAETRAQVPLETVAAFVQRMGVWDEGELTSGLEAFAGQGAGEPARGAAVTSQTAPKAVGGRPTWLLPHLWTAGAVVGKFPTPRVPVSAFEGTTYQDAGQMGQLAGRFMAVVSGLMFVSGGEEAPGVLVAGPVDSIGGSSAGSAVTAAGKAMVEARRSRTTGQGASDTIEGKASTNSPSVLLDQYVQQEISAAYAGAGGEGVGLRELLQGSPYSGLFSADGLALLRVTGLAGLLGRLYVRVGVEAEASGLPDADAGVLAAGPIVLEIGLESGSIEVQQVLQLRQACDSDCGGLASDGNYLYLPLALGQSTGIAVAALSGGGLDRQGIEPASGAGADASGASEVQPVDILATLPFPALTKAARAWGCRPADASRSIAICTDGVELHMACPRCPATSDEAPGLSTEDKTAPTVLQLDLATGLPTGEATRRRLIASGEDPATAHGARSFLPARLLVEGNDRVLQSSGTGGLGVVKLNSKTLVAADAPVSCGKLRWKMRFVSDAIGDHNECLLLGACADTIRNVTDPTSSANRAVLVHAKSGRVIHAGVETVALDRRYGLRAGDVITVELDLGDGEGHASMHVGCSRYPMRCISRDIRLKKGQVWRPVVGNSKDNPVEIEMLEVVHFEPLGSSSAAGRKLPFRCDAFAFDAGSGLAYTTDAVSGEIQVLAPADPAARDPYGLLGRMSETLTAKDGTLRADATTLLGDVSGGVVSKLVVLQMMKAHRTGAAVGKTVGLPPRSFALLLLSALTQRAIPLAQPDLLTPRSQPSQLEVRQGSASAAATNQGEASRPSLVLPLVDISLVPTEAALDALAAAAVDADQRGDVTALSLLLSLASSHAAALVSLQATTSEMDDLSSRPWALALRGLLVSCVTGLSCTMKKFSREDHGDVRHLLRQQALWILVRSSTHDPLAVRPQQMGQLVAVTVEAVAAALDSSNSMGVDKSLVAQLSGLLQSAVDDSALMVSAVLALMPTASEGDHLQGWEDEGAFLGLSQLCRVVSAVLSANSRVLLAVDEPTESDTVIFAAAPAVLRFFSKFCSSVVASCCSYASQAPTMAHIAAQRMLAMLKLGARALLQGAESFVVGARAGPRPTYAGEPPFSALNGGASVPVLLLLHLVGLSDAAMAVYSDVRAGLLSQGFLPLVDSITQSLSSVRHAAMPLALDWMSDAKRGLRHSRKMLARSRELAMVLMIGAAPVRRFRIVPAVMQALQSPLLFGGLLNDSDQDAMVLAVRQQLTRQQRKSESAGDALAALADEGGPKGPTSEGFEGIPAGAAAFAAQPSKKARRVLAGLTQPKRTGLTVALLRALKASDPCYNLTRGCAREELPAKLSLAAAAVLHSGLADEALRLALRYREAKKDPALEREAIDKCPGRLFHVFARVANQTMSSLLGLGTSTRAKALPVVVARARLLLSAVVVYPRGGRTVWARVRASFLHFAGLSSHLRLQFADKVKSTMPSAGAGASESKVEKGELAPGSSKAADVSGPSTPKTPSMHTALLAMSGKRQAQALHKLVVAAKAGNSAQRMAGFDPAQAVIDFGLSFSALRQQEAEVEVTESDAVGSDDDSDADESEAQPVVGARAPLASAAEDAAAAVTDSLASSSKDEMMARTRAAMVRATALREACSSLRRYLAMGDVTMVGSTLRAITAGLRFPLARSVLAGSGGGTSGAETSGSSPTSATEGLSSGSGQTGRMTVVEGEVTVDVNSLAGLEGCSAVSRAEVREATREAIGLAVRVLKEGVPATTAEQTSGDGLAPVELQRFSSTGGASMATIADEEEDEEDFGDDALLAARHAALLVIAQDFNVGDAPTLLDTGALQVLRAVAFLGVSGEAVRQRSALPTAASGAGAEESKTEELGTGESKEPDEPSTALTHLLDDPAGGGGSGAVHHAKSARLVAKQTYQDAVRRELLPGAETLAGVATAVLRVAVVRLVGMAHQLSADALSSASGASAESVARVQRLLFAETTEALANAAWRAGMTRLALLNTGAVELSDASGHMPVDASDDGSELALVPCVPGDLAIPAFLDAAPRTIAGVPLSRRFTMSAWIFPSKAPAHEQHRLAQLRASDLAAVDVGTGSTAEAQSFVLGALVKAASEQRKLRASAKEDGSITVNHPGQLESRTRMSLEELVSGSEPIPIKEARMALGGTSENDLALRMVAGAASDEDMLLEMQASLSRFGVVTDVAELQQMAQQLGVALGPSRRVVAAPRTRGARDRQSASSSSVQASTTWDFGSKVGDARAQNGDDSIYDAQGEVTTKATQGISKGILEWEIEYITGGSQNRLIGGIIGGNPQSEDYRNNGSKYVVVDFYDGERLVGGTAHGSLGLRFPPGEKRQFRLDLNDGSSPGKFECKIPSSSDWSTIWDRVEPAEWYPVVNFRRGGNVCRMTSMTVTGSDGVLGGVAVAASAASASTEVSRTERSSHGKPIRGVIGRYDPRRSAELSCAFKSKNGSGRIQDDDKTMCTATGVFVAEGEAMASDGILQWTVSCTGNTGHKFVGACRGEIRSAGSIQRGITIRARDGRVYKDGRRLRLPSERNYRYGAGRDITFRLDLGEGESNGKLSVKTTQDFEEIVGDLPIGAWRPVVLTCDSPNDASFTIKDAFHRADATIIRTRGGGSSGRSRMRSRRIARGGGGGRSGPLSNEIEWESRKGRGILRQPNRIYTSQSLVVRSKASASAGTLRWSVKYVEQAGGSNVALGAILGEVASPAYNSSQNKAALVCGTNGNVYVNGSSQGSLSARSFKPNDIIQFRLELNDGTQPASLYMKKNSETEQSISEELPPGGVWFACIACYHSKQTVEIQSMSQSAHRSSARGGAQESLLGLSGREEGSAAEAARHNAMIAARSLAPVASSAAAGSSVTAEVAGSCDWDWSSAKGAISQLGDSPSRTQSKRSDGAVRGKEKFSSGKARWTVRYLEGSERHPKTAIGIFKGELDVAEFDKPGGSNHYAIVNASHTGRLRVNGVEKEIMPDRKCGPGMDVHFELDMILSILKIKIGSGPWLQLADDIPQGDWSPVVFTFGKKEKVQLIDVKTIEALDVDEDPAVPSISNDVPRAVGTPRGAAGGGGSGSAPVSVARMAEVAGTADAAFVVNPGVLLRTRLRAAMAAPIPQSPSAIVEVASEPESDYVDDIGKIEGEVLAKLVVSSKSKYNPRVLESPHNYRPNMHTLDQVQFERTRRILVSFDDRTRTESGCDWIRCLKNTGKSDSEFWGSSMDGNRFPGQPGGNSAPLEIPDSKFALRFHSDGSNEMWGYKLYAWPVSSSSEVARGPIVLESPHNYSANTNWDHSLEFPGATTIKVRFDSRTKTESGCDTFRIHESNRNGRVLKTFSGTDFPGVNGQDDFVVRGNRIGISFRTDGSNQMWGWKVTFTPEGLPSMDSTLFKPNAASARAASLARGGLDHGLLQAPGLMASDCRCIAAAMRTELGSASIAGSEGTTESLAVVDGSPVSLDLERMSAVATSHLGWSASRGLLAIAFEAGATDNAIGITTTGPGERQAKYSHSGSKAIVARGDGHVYRNGVPASFSTEKSAVSRKGSKGSKGDDNPVRAFGPVRFAKGDTVVVVIDMNDGTKPGCAAIAVGIDADKGCGPFMLAKGIPAGTAVRPIAYGGVVKSSIGILELARDDPLTRFGSVAAVATQQLGVLAQGTSSSSATGTGLCHSGRALLGRIRSGVQAVASAAAGFNLKVGSYPVAVCRELFESTEEDSFGPGSTPTDAVASSGTPASGAAGGGGGRGTRPPSADSVYSAARVNRGQLCTQTVAQIRFALPGSPAILAKLTQPNEGASVLECTCIGDRPGQETLMIGIRSSSGSLSMLQLSTGAVFSGMEADILHPDGDLEPDYLADLAPPRVRHAAAVRQVRLAALPSGVISEPTGSSGGLQGGLWLDGAFAAPLARLRPGEKYEFVVAFSSVAVSSDEKEEYSADIPDDVVEDLLQDAPMPGKPRVLLTGYASGTAAKSLSEFVSHARSRGSGAVPPATGGQLSRGGVLFSKRYDGGIVSSFDAENCPLQSLSLRMLPSRQLAYVVLPTKSAATTTGESEITVEDATSQQQPMVLLTPSALQDRKWNHVAVSHDGRQASVWINGTKQCGTSLPQRLQIQADLPTTIIDCEEQAEALASLPASDFVIAATSLSGGADVGAAETGNLNFRTDGSGVVRSLVNRQQVFLPSISDTARQVRCLVPLTAAPVRINMKQLSAHIDGTAVSAVGLPFASIVSNTGKWYFEIKLTPTHSLTASSGDQALAIHGAFGFVRQGATISLPPGKAGNATVSDALGADSESWAVELGDDQTHCMAKHGSESNYFGRPLASSRVLSFVVDSDAGGLVSVGCDGEFTEPFGVAFSGTLERAASIFPAVAFKNAAVQFLVDAKDSKSETACTSELPEGCRPLGLLFGAGSALSDAELQTAPSSVLRQIAASRSVGTAQSLVMARSSGLVGSRPAGKFTADLSTAALVASSAMATSMVSFSVTNAADAFERALSLMQPADGAASGAGSDSAKGVHPVVTEAVQRIRDFAPYMAPAGPMNGRWYLEFSATGAAEAVAASRVGLSWSKPDGSRPIVGSKTLGDLECSFGVCCGTATVQYGTTSTPALEPAASVCIEIDIDASSVRAGTVSCSGEDGNVTRWGSALAVPGLQLGSIVGGGARLSIDLAPEVSISIRLGHGHGTDFVGKVPEGSKAFGLNYRPGPKRASSVTSEAAAAFPEAAAFLASAVGTASKSVSDAPLVIGRPSSFAGAAGVISSLSESGDSDAIVRKNAAHAAWAGADALVTKACVLPYHAAPAAALAVLGGQSAHDQIASDLGVDPRELARSADPLLEFDCGVGSGVPAAILAGASRSMASSPRAQGAAALSVAAAASAGPLGSLFLGSVEALASLLAIFFGRDPQASLAAGNILSRVLQETEPDVADQAMQYYRHAGTEGALLSSKANKAGAAGSFLQAILRSAGMPFSSASGLYGLGAANSFASQGLAARCANLLQVFLISVRKGRGPVSQAWYGALRKTLGTRLANLPVVLRELQGADLEIPSSANEVAETCGAMLVCGADFGLLRTGSRVRFCRDGKKAGAAESTDSSEGLVILPLSDVKEGGPGLRISASSGDDSNSDSNRSLADVGDFLADADVPLTSVVAMSPSQTFQQQFFSSVASSPDWSGASAVDAILGAASAAAESFVSASVGSTAARSGGGADAINVLQRREFVIETPHPFSPAAGYKLLQQEVPCQDADRVVIRIDPLSELKSDTLQPRVLVGGVVVIGEKPKSKSQTKPKQKAEASKASKREVTVSVPWQSTPVRATEVLPRTLNAMTEVVRGPSWTSGNVDGGVGSPGLVMSVEGKTVNVLWQQADSMQFHTYDHAAEKFDVIPRAIEKPKPRPKPKKTSPAVVAGAAQDPALVEQDEVYVFGREAAKSGIRIEVPAGLRPDGEPIWGFRAQVEVERYVSKEQARAISSADSSEDAQFMPQAAPAALLRYCAAQSLHALLTAPLARGISLEASPEIVRGLAAALSTAVKASTSDHGISPEVARLNNSDLQSRLDKLLLAAGEGPASARQARRGAGGLVTTASAELIPSQPQVLVAASGAGADTPVGGGGAASSASSGASLASSQSSVFTGVASITKTSVLELQSLREWLSSQNDSPLPAAVAPPATGQSSYKSEDHPALRVFDSESLAKKSMSRATTSSSRPVVEDDGTIPSVADGIEGTSGAACLPALEETLRVAESRVYSAALAQLLQSPLAAALTELDMGSSASQAAKQQKALDLVKSTTSFIEDALAATLAAQEHSESGADDSPSAAIESLNESIRSRIVEVAGTPDGVGAAAAMYAAAYALEKKVAASLSSQKEGHYQADILLDAMCMTATSLCEGTMRGSAIEAEAAKRVLDVLLSPRCIAVATASFTGQSSPSGPSSIAMKLGALVYIAAKSFEPGTDSPHCLQGDEVVGLARAMKPLCEKVAKTLEASSNGMLGSESRNPPKYSVDSGELCMLPRDTQRLGELAAQLVQGLLLLVPHVAVCSQATPASGAGADEPGSSNIDQAAYATTLLKEVARPLTKLPGFSSLVEFDSIARDLSRGFAPHRLLVGVLSGFLSTSSSRVVDLEAIVGSDGFATASLSIPGAESLRVVISSDTPVGDGTLDIENVAGAKARVQGPSSVQGGELVLPEALSGFPEGTTAFPVAQVVADDATMAPVSSAQSFSSKFAQATIEKRTPARRLLAGEDGPAAGPVAVGATAMATGTLQRSSVVLVNLEASQKVTLDQKSLTASGAPALVSVAVPRLSVHSGKWYFEATASRMSAGGIGVANARFRPLGRRGAGVGSDDGSWGLDMQSGNVLTGKTKQPYFKHQVLADDVTVQVAIDADANTVAFGRDGNLVARLSEHGAHLPTSGDLYPVASLGPMQAVQFAFGSGTSGKLKFSPPSGFTPIGSLVEEQAVVESSTRLAAVAFEGSSIEVTSDGQSVQSGSGDVFHTAMFPQLAVSTGKWVYEMDLTSAGSTQVGWMERSCSINHARGQGVGDVPNSACWDGSRQLAYVNGSASTRIGRKWRANHTVQCYIDADKREVSWRMNNREDTFKPQSATVSGSGPLLPAASLYNDESVTFRFGGQHSAPLKTQPLGDYRPLGECMSGLESGDIAPVSLEQLVAVSKRVIPDDLEGCAERDTPGGGGTGNEGQQNLVTEELGSRKYLDASFHGSVWMTVGFKNRKPRAITRVSIRSANDAPERDPKHVMVYVREKRSDDEWVLVAEDRSVSFPGRHRMYHIDIPAVKVQLAVDVKLVVKAIAGSGNMMQVNMIQLHAIPADEFAKFSGGAAGGSGKQNPTEPFRGYGVPVAGNSVRLRWKYAGPDGPMGGHTGKLRVVVFPAIVPQSSATYITGRFQLELEEQSSAQRRAMARIQREGVREDLMLALSGSGMDGDTEGSLPPPSTEQDLVRQSYAKLFRFSQGGFAGTEADEELLDLLDDAATRKNWSAQKIISCSWTDVHRATHLKEAAYPALSSVLQSPQGQDKVQFRLMMIQKLNSFVQKALPWIDTTLAGADEAGIATRLASVAHLVGLQLKMPLWKKRIQSTQKNSGQFGFSIDRIRPTTMLGGGRQDTEGRHTVFSQAFRLMGSKSPTDLRGGQNHRMFEVSFRNEGAIDAGGPYRESFTLLSEDLMSDRMTLFIDPTAKLSAASAVGGAAGGGGGDGAAGGPPSLTRQSSVVQTETGALRVMNPGATSEVETKLFQFLGRYMGMVMRQQIYVPMQCSSLFWKSLTGAACDELDLRRTDYETWARIDQVRRDAANMSEREFQEANQDLSFVVSASDGAQVELIPKGRQRKVTRLTAGQWAHLALRFRLRTEQAPAAAAVRAGLATIVPAHLLPLFSWRQARRLVCGDDHVDIDALKQNTTYEGHRRDGPVIRRFWAAMEAMPDSQRRAFIRFVWGRSTLPAPGGQWSEKFKISGRSGRGLPHAHTCFFQIELPSYETDEEMRSKLAWACAETSMLEG